ncbi:hypothetical protein MPTK2_7g09700 [Marchantia polymorpha subsp. ruderalis]
MVNALRQSTPSLSKVELRIRCSRHQTVEVVHGVLNSTSIKMDLQHAQIVGKSSGFRLIRETTCRTEKKASWNNQRSVKNFRRCRTSIKATGGPGQGGTELELQLHMKSFSQRQTSTSLIQAPAGRNSDFGYLCSQENSRIAAVLRRERFFAKSFSSRFSTPEFHARGPPSARQITKSLPENNVLRSGFCRLYDALRQSGSNLFSGIEASGFGRRFLISLLSSALFGIATQTPPSLGETLPHLPSIARSIDLPLLPTEFPDLGDITPLAYEQFTLPNGLRVFLLEDHELGLVGGELLVRGGGRLEPGDKVGLAAMSAIVQRSGGTQTHPAEELDSKLEVMAARIEASSSVSEMTVGFRCLTEDVNTVFSLFSEVVQEPLMPQEKLEFTRSQFLGGIARRADDAGGIAAREFSKLLYGSESVYARVPEISTVNAISRDDLRAFHRQNFRPEKGVLGIWGDFNSKAVKKMVGDRFGGWTVSTQGSPFPVSDIATPLETGFASSTPSVYVIDRPGLTQGYVRMGEFGTTLADDDVFALDVLNGILNGFGGLLFDEVRSREGLAYSVSGGWSPAIEHRGAFIAGGETRVQAIPQFVQAVQRVLNSVTSNLADSDSLARAKEAALNSFVFNFADSGSQLVRVLSYELFGIDQDFLFKYKRGVEATTALDVLKAAQRHLHPNAQPILIVTDAEKLASVSSIFEVPVVSLRPNYAPQAGAVMK